MPTVTITQNQTEFRALAGNLYGSGRTMGEALDSLVEQGHLKAPIVIQKFGGDEFFTQQQHDRMNELQRRIGGLSAEECTELEALINAELDAVQARLKAAFK